MTSQRIDLDFLLFHDSLPPMTALDLVRAAVKPAGWTSFRQIARHTGLPPTIINANLVSLIELGVIRKWRKGLYALRAKATLNPVPSPTELVVLRNFKPRKWRGYWQVMEGMGQIGNGEAHNSRITRTNGIYLTRLVRRGLLFRPKRGTYALTEAGILLLLKENR